MKTHDRGQVELNRLTARTRLLETLLVAIVALLIGWFYYWTAFPISRGDPVGKNLPGYYNMQARGFLKGQLALDAPVDPVLATLQNPLDPVQRAGRGLHDASYYKGKYHMYFGAGPVVLVFLPTILLTGGTGIAEGTVVVAFSWLGYLGATVLLLSIRRRHFPSLSLGWVLAWVVTLALATLVPSLLRRPSIWEVPITGAYACITWGLFALWKALQSRHAVFWMAAASTAYGFTVASRPVYLFACAALLVPVWYLARRQSARSNAQTNPDVAAPATARALDWRRLLLAAVLPTAAIGIGLALYNYLRFDNPLEFGQRYQMAGDDVTKLTLFSWTYPLYNLRLYLLEPAGWSPYFPFFTVINPPPAPPGFVGVENAYGVLSNIPVTWLGLGCFVVLWKVWRQRVTSALAPFVIAAAFTGLLTFCVLLSFGWAANRYQVDFLPTFVLCGCIGGMALLNACPARGWVKWVSGVFVAGVLLFSSVFGVLVSLQHNELLRSESPKTYARVARQANHVTHAWDRLTGVKYGPIEMKVSFSPTTGGAIEGLVATGTSFRADYIYLLYGDNHEIRFGFEHTSYGGPVGPAVRIEPGRVYTLLIHMGSLYPPEAHPFFETMEKRQRRAIQRTLSVSLDNQVVLETNADFYDATARRPTLGSSGARPGFRTPFSGRIISSRRAPELIPSPPPIEYGPVQIRLKLPGFSGARNEPLLCSGETGHGDLIYLQYESERSVRIGHDNWGGGGRTSESIEVDPAAVHTIEIDFPALYPAEGDPAWKQARNDTHLILKWNGKVVYDAAAPAHRAEPDTVVIGSNPIGASSASAGFSGTIDSSRRIPPLRP